MTFTVNHQWGNAEDTVTGNCTWLLMHGNHTHTPTLSPLTSGETQPDSLVYNTKAMWFLTLNYL